MEMSENTGRAYGQFLDGLSEIERDRMEPCAYCGKVWYAIHHVDGFCHECRPIMQERRVRFKIILIATLVMLAFIAIASLFGAAPS